MKKLHLITNILFAGLALTVLPVAITSCTKQNCATITFESSEGGTIKGVTSYKGFIGIKWKDVTYKPETIADQHHIFDGWYNGETKLTDDTEIKTDTKIIAKFAKYKNTNPHEGLEDPLNIQTVESIKRLDEHGYLYFMENYTDYYNDPYINSVVWTAEQVLKSWTDETAGEFVDACSAFCSKDFEGNMITGRAYDFPHQITVDEKKVDTGLNIMIHTPKNTDKGVKHESIGTTDAFLVLSQLVEGFKNGSLDDKTTDISMATLLPWITTDGVNDVGLTASILLLPLDNTIGKNYSEPSSSITIKRPDIEQEVSIARSVRYVLDNCATVNEAEEFLKKCWFNRILKNNFHLFVTDKNGESRLFEWYMTNDDANEQKMTITKTNAATNFYQTFSNCDSKMPQITGLKNKYHYGYSRPDYRNTYDRFNTIISMLDFYTEKAPAEGEFTQAVMKEQTMDALLRILALYQTPAGVDSQTQFSCLFNTKDLTQKIYSFSDLTTSWTYCLKDHKLIKNN